MKNMTLGKSAFKGLAILLTCSTFSLTAQAETYYASQSAEGAVRINPAPIDRKTADYSKLTIITSSDLPESLKDKIYNRPVQMRKVEPRDLIPAPSSGYSYSDSLVSQKIHGLKSNLSSLQMNIENLAQNLSHIESKSDAWAADYYASIATINTRLQSGTTPGNPRLISELSMAENKLDSLTNTLQNLNLLSTKANELSSQSAFLLEETRAAYGISGAVEEDHANLARLEDSIANTTVAIERILNNTSDNITRTSGYLSSERDNLRTLALAVSKGDLYGKSLSNRPFSGQIGSFQQAAYTAPTPTHHQAEAAPAAIHQTNAPAPAADLSGGPRPLAKIKFDRADIEYEQPLYTAVNEALQRYPNARFDLVAVQPTQGNAAQTAIESTKARRNAERVLRTLTEMGLQMEQIDLSYSKNPSSAVNEVHLYIK